VVVGPGTKHWTLISGEETALETRFTRRLEISNICRNPRTGDIRPNCGNGESIDEYSRLVTETVIWSESGQTRQLTTSWVVAKI